MKLKYILEHLPLPRVRQPNRIGSASTMSHFKNKLGKAVHAAPPRDGTTERWAPPKIVQAIAQVVNGSTNGMRCDCDYDSKECNKQQQQQRQRQQQRRHFADNVVINLEMPFQPVGSRRFLAKPSDVIIISIVDPEIKTFMKLAQNKGFSSFYCFFTFGQQIKWTRTSLCVINPKKIDPLLDIYLRRDGMRTKAALLKCPMLRRSQ